MEILKIVSSILTPIIVLILGLVINKNLEKIKVSQSKDKDWKNHWASRFLDIAHDYNVNMSKCLTGLQIMTQINAEKNVGWESELKDMETRIRQGIRNIQYLDWEINNYVQFAQNNKDIVLESQQKLLELLGKILKDKGGNLEEIRNVQYCFNNAVRSAHAEILGIDIR